MTTLSRHALTPNFTRDERARAAFASEVRRQVMDTIAANLRADYERHVAPRLTRPSAREIHAVLRRRPSFQFYSSLRVTSQDLLYQVVRPVIEREQPALRSRARQVVQRRAGGSLRLQQNFPVPRSVSAVDVHLMPGSYTAEYGADDLTMGLVYENRLAISTFGVFGPDLDDIGQSFARFIRARHPSFRPQRILDLGCTVGHNTTAWKDVYPDAEVHGIDVAAPCLRFAAARSQARGRAVHFSQMNAEMLDFPDHSFDVVFSSMFLHEVPLKGIDRVMAEAHRVLRPGGLMLHMELPPASALSAYDSFYLDWDGHYNNEPFYQAFRAADLRDLVKRAGFHDERFVEHVVPSWSALGEQRWHQAIEGDALPVNSDKTGRLTTGIRWYGFGAWKSQGERR